MGTQQLPLCWNNHQTEILATFQRLLVEESFVDVTLACEGISLKAHKAILSACSPFFQDLFMENPCKHPIVIMKDIKYRDLKGIVDFMYHGGINVAPDQLSEFLKTAEALKVKGLLEHSSTTILDLNKQLRAQEKTPKKTTLFQQSLPSCLQSKDFAQIQSIRKNNACCEQQSSTATDFVAGRDVCTVEERTKVFSVKSEPIEDACSEEILPEHTSDDSLLSVHYDEMFVPQMEITEGDQNLVLVPRCPQEIITSEALQQSAQNASSHDTMLPLGHTTSAESLGVVISPDVTENSESVMQYMPFEHSNVAIHSSPNQDIKPVALTSYEESVVCPTSNQLHQRYNSADLRVKRTADSLEENSFISYEHEGKTSTCASLCGNQLKVVEGGNICIINNKELQQNIDLQRNFQDDEKMQTTEDALKSTDYDVEKTCIADNEKYLKQCVLLVHNDIVHSKHPNAFLQHKKKNIGEKLIPCNRYNKTSKTEGLQQSQLPHSRQRLYTCDICKKIFMSNAKLKIHKRSHTGERPYQCEVCHYKFTTKGNLTIHKRKHTGERPYHCILCGKSFTHCSTLCRHKRIHV